MDMIISPTSGLRGIPSIFENAASPSLAAASTINFDVTSQSVLNYTVNATANWTLNIRGNSTTTLNDLMPTGTALTVVFMAKQGATAFYNNAFTIDSVVVTPKWQSGIAPTIGNINSIDVYTYAILKTAPSTYTVLATQTKFA